MTPQQLDTPAIVSPALNPVGRKDDLDILIEQSNEQRPKASPSSLQSFVFAVWRRLLEILNIAQPDGDSILAGFGPSSAATLNEANGMNYDFFSLSPQEEALHKARLSAQALSEQMGKERRSEEDIHFSQQLKGKNLAELMDVLQGEREAIDRNSSPLNNVKANTAYYGTTPGPESRVYLYTLSSQDFDRMIAAYRAAHLPGEVNINACIAFSTVREGKNPAKELDETKKWLKDTFSKPTDAVLLKMRDGENVIAMLGVSSDEIACAKGLQEDRRRAEARVAEIGEQIKQRVKEQSQKSPAPTHGDQLSPLATPSAVAAPLRDLRKV